MTKSTIYWRISSVVFAVAIIMSLLTFIFGGGILAVLQLATVVVGWILWGIGLICRLRGD